MEIISLVPDKYKEWDSFCETSDGAWFWHTSLWLEYTLNYKPLLKSESKSFFVFKNNQIIAICPLVLETYENIKEFSFGEGYGPVPAFANFITAKEKHDAEKVVFKHIDKLAIENSVSRAKFRFSVLSKFFLGVSGQKINFLTKYGYLDNSLSTQVLDIKKPIEEIKKELRHGHGSDVGKASKVFKAKVFDKKNITEKIFHEYVNLHQKAAGRVTRPKITFDIMYGFIKDKEAFLVGSEKDGKFIGFSYFFVFKNNAYYGSSCIDPEMGNMPVSHFIQWKAIEWMKSKGISFYEIGDQHFSNSIYDFPSQKQIFISRFKRGFGGFPVPLFRGEKYYNREYFLKIYNERINKFSDSI